MSIILLPEPEHIYRFTILSKKIIIFPTTIFQGAMQKKHNNNHLNLASLTCFSNPIFSNHPHDLPKNPTPKNTNDLRMLFTTGIFCRIPCFIMAFPPLRRGAGSRLWDGGVDELVGVPGKIGRFGSEIWTWNF